MAKVIDCTVYRVKLNGAGQKKYFAKFAKMRGVVKNHERMDDALLFTLEGIKLLSLAPGEPRIRRKTAFHFAIRYDSLGEEVPFELHGKTVVVYHNKIAVE